MTAFMSTCGVDFIKQLRLIGIEIHHKVLAPWRHLTRLDLAIIAHVWSAVEFSVCTQSYKHSVAVQLQWSGEPYFIRDSNFPVDVMPAGFSFIMNAYLAQLALMTHV